MTKRKRRTSGTRQPETRKRRTSGTRQSETRTRELGAPVVVAARYPQELLAQIDTARAEEPRQQWLVEAARQRLEREAVES